MLHMADPALIIGIASSLVLIVVMKGRVGAANDVMDCYPGKFGINIDSPVWIVLMLTLTGIAVGLVIRFSPGHAGP